MLQEARAAGWVSAASPMLPLNHAWDYFSFADIHWGAFARVGRFSRFSLVLFLPAVEVTLAHE